MQKKLHELQAVLLGLGSREDPAVDDSMTPTIESPVKLRRLFEQCAATYLGETKEHKSIKTLAAYRCSLDSFGEVIGPEYLDDITRDDMLSWIAALRKKGNPPRTIRNRVDCFQIFLHYSKLPSLLLGKDLPKFTDKKVRAYNQIELGKMIQQANQDESDLLHFLLCTGAREQEAQYVCWSDVDLERKTYTVTEHLDMGDRPKDKEEGTLPIPDLLVAILKERRSRHPRSRLIFPGQHGAPNGRL